MKMKHAKYYIVVVMLVCLLFLIAGCTLPDSASDASEQTAGSTSEEAGLDDTTQDASSDVQETSAQLQMDTQAETVPDNLDPSYSLSVQSLPAYAKNAFTVLNDGKPAFSVENLTTDSFENYSELDSFGRCGVCFANVGVDLMPTEERGEIGNVKPSGWHTVKYNDYIEDNYLYNRCHLIAFQLAGENDNVCNLITGTRYLNIEGMQGFENQVAEYVKGTGNHVLYRVTPHFVGDNLVASGVEIEAYSVEDLGAGVCFHVYCYNVQPHITIDYATGESWVTEVEVDTTEVADTTAATEVNTIEENQSHYILNTNTRKFHDPWCSSVSDMKEKNKQEFWGDRQDLINAGYSPCKRCNP